jgi:GAF domain-containing protein
MVDDQGMTQIIGALEVRAENRIGRLHNTETQSVIQSICDQFAQIIQTVRRIDGLEQRARTGDALLEQVRSQLQESQRLTQRMTSSVWAQYVRDIEQGAGLSVDFERDVVEANTDWTPTLTEARRINHLVQEQRDDIQVIAMPLRVRGQVVGAMEFELDNQRDFTPEDLELLQEVSERFGLAAENSRLLEDTRRAAQREALVNQIAARLQSTTSVNATLLEAARSLREAIKANKVAIRLGNPNIGDAS